MSNTISILLADDHSLIRNGLRQVLEREGDYHIFEADNGDDALKIIQNESLQLAILDIEMPNKNGFEVAKTLYKKGITLDVIFLTMYKDATMFNQAMDIGVKGYVLKENTVSEIIQCLNTVREGNLYLSPAMSEFLVRRNEKLMAEETEDEEDGLQKLTPTETNVMKLLSEMKTNQEIAEEMEVSIKTIQNHRNNICHKLDISGTHALLKFAIEHADDI